jgi:ATP-dependent DNA helicase DinG
VIAFPWSAPASEDGVDEDADRPAGVVPTVDPMWASPVVAGREPDALEGDQGARPAALDREAIVHDLGPDGPVARALASTGQGAAPGYEDRASQRAMASEVAAVYNRGGIALLEAGTGVGKSLAYLVPALRWAAVSGERTVVSTNTINLQEQLVGKDLPLLAAALSDQPVRFALLKGWRNYLCLHRLEHALTGAPALFDAHQQRDLAAVAAWSQRTTDGSLADAPTPPHPEVWDEVAAEPDLCGRQRCPHYDRCFVFRARRTAAQADVVVVNHHLLMSDIAVRRVQHNWHEAAVLPAYARLVIDEGHHLEEAAASHLGTTVTRRAWERLMARLDRRGGKGLLTRLGASLRGVDDLLSAASLDLIHDTLLPATATVRERGDLVFDLLAALLAEAKAPQLRLDESFANHPVWAAGLSTVLERLLRDVNALDDGLRIIQGRHAGEEIQDEVLGRTLGELRGVGRRLTAAASALCEGLAPTPGSEPTVRWLERRRTSGDHAGRTDRAINVAVCAVPLDLAPILREDLFARVDTAIVTSATLAAEGRFDFLAARLGVDAPSLDLRTARFASPFDYERQALLAIPTDVPAPNVDQARHTATVAQIVRDVVHAAGGGVFVLLTSHRDVRALAETLHGDVDGSPVAELLVHGDEPRDVLLRRFRASGDAVLLGTASFWEGVDVPGRALRALVIARLPFRVPTEPVTAAQCERIAARGGDPFVEYMLPQASLRLNQGFGRLIRSTSDRGVVVLADPRIVTKVYGRGLLDALPPARRMTGPWRAVRRHVESFFHSDSATP